MRRLYEAKELASFDRAKLIQLREGQREFSGESDEALYARWKAARDCAVFETLEPGALPQPAVRGAFSTHLLEHDYGLFGSFPG